MGGRQALLRPLGRPCGRLVLGVLRRLDDAEAVALSDDVCTGLQLVNFLQDVPRDLALGRVYLPAEDRSALRSHRARPAERAAAALCRYSRPAGPAALLASGEAARAQAGRPNRPRRDGVRTRRACGRRSARAGRLRRFLRPAQAFACAARTNGDRGARPVMAEDAYAEVERLTRHARAQLRLRNHAAAAAQAAGDRRNLRLRAARRRHRGRTAAGRGEARRSWSSFAGSSARRPARTRCWSPSPTQGGGSRSRRTPCMALIDGGVQDTEQTRYADFDELRGVLLAVAGAVGRRLRPGLRRRPAASGPRRSASRCS